MAEHYPGAWLPGVEANQGLFSLLALAAAIAIAWLEFMKARRAERARVGEPAQIAIDLLDAVIAQCRAGRDSEHAAAAARDEECRALQVFDVLKSTPTPSAPLMICFNETYGLLERLARGQGALEIDAERRRIMGVHIEQLMPMRSKLAKIANDAD